LSQLNPQLRGTVADGVLRLNCPHPGCSHRLVLRLTAGAPHWVQRPESPGRKEYVWQASGSFPDSLSLQPSVDVIEADAQGNKIRTLCWHGHITNGDVT
jgi:hypothetical protein